MIEWINEFCAWLNEFMYSYGYYFGAFIGGVLFTCFALKIADHFIGKKEQEGSENDADQR